jgi:hypothetical protein
MKPTDPIELFNHLEPPAPTDAEQRNADVLAAVHAHTAKGTKRRTRNPWILGGGAVAIVLATAAFAVLRTSPVSDPTAVSCLATTNLDGDLVGLAASDDPVEACRELWIDGTLGDGEVPPLSGCVNEAGAAVVVPAGDAVCNRLSLDELEPGINEEQHAVLGVNRSLIDLFGSECFEHVEAVEEVQRQLAAAGLAEWTVDAPEPFNPATPCAVPGVDPVNRRIVVIGARER